MSLPDDLVVEMGLEYSMNNKFSAIHYCNKMILFFTRSTFSIFEHLYKIKCRWSNNQYRWNIQKRILFTPITKVLILSSVLMIHLSGK